MLFLGLCWFWISYQFHLPYKQGIAWWESLERQSQPTGSGTINPIEPKWGNSQVAVASQEQNFH